MSDLVKRLRWGWPETEIASKDMPRVRADAIEAADRIEALEAALMPFGEIDGEGDEDFPDETPVTLKYGRTTDFSLTLGDLRRARATLKQD